MKTQGIIIESKMTYAAKLFTAARNKIEIGPFIFNDFFIQKEYKRYSNEDSVHRAVIYTYYIKTGESFQECANIFRTKEEIIAEIISSHQDRYEGKHSIYYRLLLRLLYDVVLSTFLQKEDSDNEEYIVTSYEETAAKIFEGITEMTKYSKAEVLSPSRKGNLPPCKTALVSSFYKIHPNAKLREVGVLFNRNYSQIIQDRKNHDLHMSRGRDQDSKAGFYRSLYAHILSKLVRRSA